ncbi:MAG: hypothetical protein ACOC57_01075 [Acidobacteriota bacterium]
MTEQLAKRQPKEWIEYVLERFNNHLISEEEACQLLPVHPWLFLKGSGKRLGTHLSGTEGF